MSEEQSPHYAGHRERLRDKFLKEGLSPLEDYEALELLLTYSIPRSDVKPLAKRLLKKLGSLSAVMDASPQELEKIDGIGGKTAAFIRLVREVNWRYMETKIEPESYLTSPRSVINFCKSRIGRESEEFMAVIFLNTKNMFIRHEVPCKGSVSSVNINMRDIVKKALDTKTCTGIIIVHNHPSGHPEPSDSDKEITRELEKTCKYMDIRLVDHIIVCSHDHYSFVENGLL